MTPARWPRSRTLENRMMVLGVQAESLRSLRVSALPDVLRSGDLLVVNDAATFPGSLTGTLGRGQELELRLMQETRPGTWLAAVLGAGNWRTKTEDRPDVQVGEGEVIVFSGDVRARVLAILGARLLEIEFEGVEFWGKLYRLGKPIQYSYLAAELPLWSVQTVYAGKPWAAEMPSAGHALNWELLLSLREKGIRLAWLTHAAGISSSGDLALDRRLPLGERYLIPQETVAAIESAERVIAVGTSVVRALEGNRLRNGVLVPGEGVTGLRLGRSFRRKVVDGLLTGMHELGESHFRLLESFAPRTQLERALKLGEKQGFLTHEFGDSCLVLP